MIGVEDVTTSTPTDEVRESWLAGELESPIVRDGDDDLHPYDCDRCGEMLEFCECPVPRLNDPPGGR